MIAVVLPTNNALNLRLASLSCLPLFYSFHFWSSRFDPDGERGFLSKSRTVMMAKDVDDLLHILRLSRSSVAIPDLLNRKRVCTLARRLAMLAKPSLSKHGLTPYTMSVKHCRGISVSVLEVTRRKACLPELLNLQGLWSFTWFGHLGATRMYET